MQFDGHDEIKWNISVISLFITFVNQKILAFHFLRKISVTWEGKFEKLTSENRRELFR